MIISFEGQVALVTGAASGLGLATAKAFAESGASVVLADWNEAEVQAEAKKLAGKGHKTLGIPCDVSNDDEVEAMVKETVAKFGRLDAAYNNAGVQNVLAETADVPGDDYDRVMSINLRGVWSSMKFETAPDARARQRGDRQLLLAGRSRRRSSARNLPRGQAWRYWLHEERSARVRRARYPRECRLPWLDPYTDERQNGGRRSRRGIDGHAGDFGSHEARGTA